MPGLVMGRAVGVESAGNVPRACRTARPQQRGTADAAPARGWGSQLQTLVRAAVIELCTLGDTGSLLAVGVSISRDPT